MTQWLRQSTAVTVKLGPFLDASDGDTEMTGLTISQADIRLTKNGGAFAQPNNAAGATHDENGFYGVPLDTTDTGTLGTLKVFIHEATALSVWQDFMVVPANVWDSFFGADKLQVHADEITAGLITATAIATGAIDADALATDAVTEIANGVAAPTAAVIADAVWDEVILSEHEAADSAGMFLVIAGDPDVATSTAAAVAGVAVDGTTTLAESLRLSNSALGGKLSGAGTGTEVVRDLADTKGRLTYTVDDQGNRSAITRDLA